ncbi:MAG: tetratricopeptide repeat protein [Polyangia bacterium]
MTNGFSNDEARAYWSSLSERLLAEIGAGGEPARLSVLSHDLARVLGERLGSRREAEARLEAAAELSPESSEIAWDLWRSAVSRGTRERADALEALLAAARRVEDRVACQLALARLRSSDFSDPEGALESLEAAASEDSEHRGIRWTRLEKALVEGADDLPERLEEAARASGDPLWKAALLLELAGVLRDRGGDEVRRIALYEEVLQSGVRDWSVLEELARSASELGAWEVHDGALERMIAGALEEPLARNDDRPLGHDFDGLERGASAAAAGLWRLARSRERERDDFDGALEALERALELRPESILLARERTRLLAAGGRLEEAADTVFERASAGERALLELCAGRTERAAERARAAVARSGSRFLEALAELSGDEGGEADVTEAVQVSRRWLEENLDHPEAGRVAAELLAAGRGGEIARLMAAERAAADTPWPPPSEEPTPWDPPLDALRSAPSERSAKLVAWSESTSSAEPSAALLVAASRCAESEGDAVRALELAGRAEGVDPDSAAARRLSLRLLRASGRWEDLSSELERTCEESQEPESSRIYLHERAAILEHVLGDVAAAREIFTDLIALDPEDVAAAWGDLRTSIRLGDWEAADAGLERLAESHPEDAPRLALLTGALKLLVLGREAEAVDKLSAAVDSLEGPPAIAAQLLAAVAARLGGDEDGFCERLATLAGGAGSEERTLFAPELLESTRALRGTDAAAELIGDSGADDETARLWRLLAGGRPERLAGAARALSEMAETAPGEELAGACRIAASLIRSGAEEGEAGLEKTDLRSPEAVWHAADRLHPRAEGGADLLAARAELAAGGDVLEWADWLLDTAEALEDAGDAAAALEVVREGVERAEDHPGLLEALARLAHACGDYEKAAEAHGRLAGFYGTQEEKARQLLRAAEILLSDLGQKEGAERLLREAVRRVPNHMEANELLSRILREKGDESGLAEQIETHIEAEYDADRLVELYQEQADRLLAMDDFDGALEAVENLLLLEPQRAAAHRTKIDILVVAERWLEAVAALKEYAAALEDPVEARTSLWRAAEILAGEAGDIPAAVSLLRFRYREGDEHPQTLRQLADIASKGGLWEEAAEALALLAARVGDEAKRADVMREEAHLRLEKLFDPDAASEVIDRLLSQNPDDVDGLRMASQFVADPAELRPRFVKARAAIRAGLDERPVDSDATARLAEVAAELGDDVTAEACEAVLDLYRGGELRLDAEEPPAPPASRAEELVRLLAHPDDAACPASRVIRIAAPLGRAVFGDDERYPAIGRSTLVDKDDALQGWVAGWGAAIGVEELEVHRAGSDPRGCSALPGWPPSLAVAPDVISPPEARQRFFLARDLWRAAAGLGAFEEGEAAAPVRWVIAVTAATLGEDSGLPLPTDADLVRRARKAIKRKLRRALSDPCRELLATDPRQIREWAAATSYSADRFGLLATGSIGAAVALLIEESAGPSGLVRFRDDASGALSKIPRTRELLRFVLSERNVQVLEIQRGEKR